jgi:tetratricopeptide (TPR) repeat protein
MAKRRPSAPDDARELTNDPLIRVGQGLVVAKIASVVLVFDPNAADSFSLPKSAVSHSFAVLLGATLIWLALRHGRGFLRWSPLHLAAGAVVLAMVAATALALDETVALFGAWRRYLGLSQVADNAALYASAVLLFQTQLDRLRLLLAGLAVAVPVTLYALAQRAGLDFVKYKEGTSPIATLGQPDLLAAFSSIAGVTALATGVWLWRDLGRAGRAGVLSVAVGALLVEVLGGGRAGALGLFAGWAGLIAIVWFAKGPGHRRVLASVAAITLVLLVGVLVSPIGRRLSPDVLRADAAVQERFQIWEVSWRLLMDRPALGLGPDNFANGFPALRTEQSALLVGSQLENSTHSWVAYYATSSGFIGVAAMFVFVAATVAYGLKLAAARNAAALALVPAAAYLGQGLVGINDLSLDWILWLSAGVISGAASVTIPAPRRRRRRPSRREFGIAVTSLCAIALLAGAATWSRISGSHDLALAQAFGEIHNGPAAIEHARAALDQDPRRPELWASYGEALAGSGRDAPAVQAFQEAARLDPTYPLHWRNLAIELGNLGNNASAFAAVQRAVSADPYDQVALDLLARLALARGHPELAAERGTLAVKLQPDKLSTYDAPVLADLSLQQFADAERLLEQAFQNGGADNSAIRLRRAQLYAATGRKDLALVDLDRAIELDPKNADALKLKQDLLK